MSVDRSCVWSLGQVPAPSSRDYLFALGSGAVQVRRLSSDDQADRVCSHQLSAAPVTGISFKKNFISRYQVPVYVVRYRRWYGDIGTVRNSVVLTKFGV